MKSTTNVKQPKNESGVEFRWSTSIHRLGLVEDNPVLYIVDHPRRTTNVRNSAKSISPSPNSPRLPELKKGKKNISNSMNDISNGQSSPLLLTYFQLHRAQISKQKKKKPQTQYSFLPLLNEKSNNTSIDDNHQLISNDEYIRLQTSQLKRLHVSDKYIKEAKKLYFNAASKVFVPRRSIVETS